MGRPRRKNYAYIYYRRFIKFLLILIGFLVPLGIFIMTCQVKNITVEGNNHYDQDELIDMVFQKPTDGNTLLLYTRYKYDKVESIPFVEDITIEMVDKNSVHIQVHEKIIIGSIEHMGGYFYFDRDGYVVESSNETLDKVPFITGLTYSQIVLNDKLVIEKEELFSVILNITRLIYKYNLDVSSIGFNKENEITLVSGNLKILLGKRETYDEQIAELTSMIAKADNKKLIIDMKNFTEGQDRIIAKPYD